MVLDSSTWCQSCDQHISDQAGICDVRFLAQATYIAHVVCSRSDVHALADALGPPSLKLACSMFPNSIPNISSTIKHPTPIPTTSTQHRPCLPHHPPRNPHPPPFLHLHTRHAVRIATPRPSTQTRPQHPRVLPRHPEPDISPARLEDVKWYRGARGAEVLCQGLCEERGDGEGVDG